ncbi:MAG: hypothetical protein PHS79_04870 [Patescibacteria group bacterium]|nr:hypothetical protein [Patescibacteria group bacterium]
MRRPRRILVATGEDDGQQTAGNRQQTTGVGEHDETSGELFTSAWPRVYPLFVEERSFG